MEHSHSGMSRHMLIMVLCCLIPMVAIVAIAAFGISLTGVLRYALTLICPLGFVLMMVMMGRQGHDKPASEAEAGPAGQEKGASCH